MKRRSFWTTVDLVSPIIPLMRQPTGRDKRKVMDISLWRTPFAVLLAESTAATFAFVAAPNGRSWEFWSEGLRR